jgi:hypothetical protein
MSSSGLPAITIPANQWTQVDWFTGGPFPFGITRTYCAASTVGSLPLVRWRYITLGYAEGAFTECAQVTIVGIFYISVEMWAEVETVVFRG